MDLGDFVFGGTILVRAFPAPDWLAGPLLPETILSASGCLCASVPDTWAIRWAWPSEAERLEQAAAFGLTADQLEALTSWTDAAWDDHRLRWPSVLSSPDVARDLAEQFLADQADLHILGLGLPLEHVERFSVAPTGQCEGGTCCSVGSPGVYETLSLRQRLPEGGRILGYEILAYLNDAPPPCSWLCNSLHGPAAEALGITPNAAGFIESHAEAQAAADFCNRDDVPSEPAFWAPWAIVEYPLR